MKPTRRAARPDPKRLRLAIDHDGRTKGDIAKAAGITNRQVLTNILGGRGGGQYVERLARALHVSERWLTDGEEPPAWYQGPEAAVARLIDAAGSAARSGRRITENGRGEATINGAALEIYSPLADLDEAHDGAVSVRLPLFQLASVVYAMDRAARDASVPVIIRDGLRGAASSIGLGSLATRFAERARTDARFTYRDAWKELVAEAARIAEAIGAIS